MGNRFGSLRKELPQVQTPLSQPGYTRTLASPVPLRAYLPWRAWSLPEHSMLASLWPLHLQDPEETPSTD